MEVVFSLKGTLVEIVSKDEERSRAFERRRRQRDGTEVHDTVYTQYRSEYACKYYPKIPKIWSWTGYGPQES